MHPSSTIIHSASLFRRFAAAIYDLFVLIPLLFVATALAIVFHHNIAIPAQTHWFQIYLIAVTASFMVWFWKKRGQTIGMMAWHISVCNAYQQPLSWLQAIVRFILATITISSMGIGWIWAIFDPKHMTLYDRLSKTYIITNHTHKLKA